jgi:hypothetical protein
MNLHQSIDIYCERISPEFFAEPLNLSSNLAFLVAAILADRQQVELFGRRKASISFLCILLFSVGVGSSLFHSFATRWSALCDVLPIIIFVLSFTWAWVREATLPTKILGKGFLPALSCVVLLALAAIFSMYMSHLPLNGSQAYLGVFVVLLALGSTHYRLTGQWSLLLSGFLFFFSLTARSLDDFICSYFSFGTHFIWHLLNAVVCFLAISSLIHLQYLQGDRGISKKEARK